MDQCSNGHEWTPENTYWYRGYRRCQACRRAHTAKWRAANPETVRTGKARYRAANPETVRANKAEWDDRVRAETLAAYGGCCAHCAKTGQFGLTADPDALQLDHINGDGAQERKRLGLVSGVNFYQWLREQGFPGRGTRYQLLCSGCHATKTRAEREGRLKTAKPNQECLHRLDVSPPPSILRKELSNMEAREGTSRDLRSLDPAKVPGDSSEVKEDGKTARERCARGHEWSPENTIWRSDGHRQCRTCKLARQKEWRAANRDHFNAWLAKWRAAKRAAQKVVQFQGCGHDRVEPNIYTERRPDGRIRERCRECYLARSRRRNLRNRERHLVQGRERYYQNRDAILEELRQARKDDPGRFAKLRATTRAKLRAETQAAYGSVCAGCGAGGSLGQELDLDHVRGGGIAERKRLGVPSAGWQFYAWLRRQGFPGKDTDYQLLCKPCHKAKNAQESAQRARARKATS